MFFCPYLELAAVFGCFSSLLLLFKDREWRKVWVWTVVGILALWAGYFLFGRMREVRIAAECLSIAIPVIMAIGRLLWLVFIRCLPVPGMEKFMRFSMWLMRDSFTLGCHGALIAVFLFHIRGLAANGYATPLYWVFGWAIVTRTLYRWTFELPIVEETKAHPRATAQNRGFVVIGAYALIAILGYLTGLLQFDPLLEIAYTLVVIGVVWVLRGPLGVKFVWHPSRKILGFLGAPIAALLSRISPLRKWWERAMRLRQLRRVRRLQEWLTIANCPGVKTVIAMARENREILTMAEQDLRSGKQH